MAKRGIHCYRNDQDDLLGAACCCFINSSILARRSSIDCMAISSSLVAFVILCRIHGEMPRLCPGVRACLQMSCRAESLPPTPLPRMDVCHSQVRGDEHARALLPCPVPSSGPITHHLHASMPLIQPFKPRLLLQGLFLLRRVILCLSVLLQEQQAQCRLDVTSNGEGGAFHVSACVYVCVCVCVCVCVEVVGRVGRGGVATRKSNLGFLVQHTTQIALHMRAIPTSPNSQISGQASHPSPVP